MKRSEMVNSLQSIMEGFSNLPEDDINYGNGHKCVELMLDRAELLGMIPPTYEEDCCPEQFKGE